MAYGYSNRHRVKEGAQVVAQAPACLGQPLACVVMIPAALLFGSGVMSTKEKKHWLYVDYRDAEAVKQSVVKLDKSEYQKVIAAIKIQTGRDVEILPEEGKEKK